MSVPTAAETALLRTRPQNTKLYLSIYQPSVVFAGIVTGTVAKGSMDIPISNSSGTSANIRSGMTLYAGTDWGGYDKGKVRVRHFSGSVVGIAENSHINWQAGDYITVVNFYEIWPIYPRIIQDPTNEIQTLWYKDWDVEYSNENSTLGYFFDMGGHYAGFLDDGQHNVYYTAASTIQVRGVETGTSYHWAFEGGNPSTYVGVTPGYVAYDTPGHYTTRLIVSGSVTSSTDVSYRHISIYDRPGSGTSTVPLRWQLLDLSGSRDQGGYVASIRIFEPMPETQLKDGSLIVLFADDRYGTTDQSIGGNYTNREKIVFSGYIIDGTIHYNYKDSYVDFDVGSPTEIMKMSEGFSVSVQSSPDVPADLAANPDFPSGWVLVMNMNIRRALYHYLRWHSTVLQCCDFRHVGLNPSIQFFDADRTSIYDAINTLMSSAVLGGVVSDRQGKIWAESDIYVTTGSYSTGLSIDKRDWMGEPTIEERPMNEVSYIEIGGIEYNTTLNTFEAFMSAAPGTAPAYRGKIQRVQGLALHGQDHLNFMAGQLFAQLNAKYPNIEFRLAGNYRNFDLAPYEYIPVTIEANDTIRGITFNAKQFFVNNMRWEYSPKDETFIPYLGLEELGSGFPGDSIPIPDLPPIEGDDGAFYIPPIVIPPIEIPPFPTFETGGVLFAPCTYAYNVSDGLEALVFASNPLFYIFDNAKDTKGQCTFGVPVGSTQALIYPIFRNMSANTGNISLSVDTFPFDANGVGKTGASYFAYTPVLASGQYRVGLVTQTGLVAGDVVNIEIERDATDPSDTFNSGNLLFAGCLVIFA